MTVKSVVAALAYRSYYFKPLFCLSLQIRHSHDNLALVLDVFPQ